MPELTTRLESNMFSLYVDRLNTVYSAFEGQLADYVKTQSALGRSRDEILRQLNTDLANGTGIFQDLLSNTQYETDFGLNGAYQIASNEGIGRKVSWTLDPNAEHCDSCLAQSRMGPRNLADVPFPGTQPTIGETNCERYCKCTLIPEGK